MIREIIMAEPTGTLLCIWIVERNKHPKKNPIGIYTDKQKEEKIWMNDNIRKIGFFMQYSHFLVPPTKLI